MGFKVGDRVYGHAPSEEPGDTLHHRTGNVRHIGGFYVIVLGDAQSGKKSEELFFKESELSLLSDLDGLVDNLTTDGRTL